MAARGYVYLASPKVMRPLTGGADISTGPVAAPTYGTYKPDSLNTGPRVSALSLTSQTGDISVTVDNTIIQNLDLAGRIIIRANNVTIRDCIVRGTVAGYSGNTGMIDCNPVGFAGTRVQNCLLKPQTPTVWANGIIGHQYVIERTEMTNCVDGGGSYTSGPIGVEVYGCYVHDLTYMAPDSNHSDNHTHNDGWQHQGGQGLKLVGNNFVDSAGSGSNTPSPYAPSCTGQALLLGGTIGQSTGSVIDRNWFEYGQQCITVPLNSTGSHDVGLITNNRFGRGARSGRTIVIDPGMSASGLPTTTGLDVNNGNVYDDDGTPVTVTVTTSY